MLYNWWLENTFAYPWMLTLLLVIPFLIYWKIKNGDKQSASFKVSTTLYLKPIRNWRITYRGIPFVLRCLALIALIIAIARPQERFNEEQISGEGIDIVLCFDISGSMTEQDFKPNRLEAAKEIATDFVRRRTGDRIGVVIFSSQSFTLCPITVDHQTVLSQINSIQNGYLTEDGTAIGSGLATSVDRLKDSPAKTKIIVLLTDGVDFGGLIPPDIAEQLAITYNIKVYCIGIGTNSEIAVTDSASKTSQKRKLSFNENLLQHISGQTGGHYFNATDKQALKNSYDMINKLEKSKIISTNYTHFTESFLPFVLFALACIIVEFVLTLTVFNKFP